MKQEAVDVVIAIGENLLRNKNVQKGIDTTLKGTAGLGAIGVGTALETIGGGTALGAVGSTITGMGCAATQTLITGATTVLPGAIGTAVAGTIGSAATAVFTIASSPIVLGGAAVAGTIYAAKKFVDWINE